MKDNNFESAISSCTLPPERDTHCRDSKSFKNNWTGVLTVVVKCPESKQKLTLGNKGKPRFTMVHKQNSPWCHQVHAKVSEDSATELMDMQHEMRQPLEPIQEESEQEDGSIRSNMGEEEEDNFETLETEEVMAEDESEEEEEEGNDGAVSSRQLSRSLGRKSFLQTQSAFNHWKEMKNSTAPDSTDLTDEASSSRLPGSTKRKWYSHGKWRVEGFMVRKQQHKPLQQKNVRRKESRRKPAPEPFPQWVVDLMANIEEATTHKLVVE